jgi:hypothetical protein
LAFHGWHKNDSTFIVDEKPLFGVHAQVSTIYMYIFHVYLRMYISFVVQLESSHGMGVWQFVFWLVFGFVMSPQLACLSTFMTVLKRWYRHCNYELKPLLLCGTMQQVGFQTSHLWDPSAPLHASWVSLRLFVCLRVALGCLLDAPWIPPGSSWLCAFWSPWVPGRFLDAFMVPSDRNHSGFLFHSYPMISVL